MPTKLNVLPAQGLIFTTYTGVLNLPEILKLIDEVEEQTSLHNLRFEFSDMSQVREVDIAAEDIEKVADLIVSLSRVRRWSYKKAIYATSGVGFAAAEAFVSAVSNAENFEVGVFSNPAAALEFLQQGENSALAQDSTLPFLHNLN